MLRIAIEAVRSSSYAGLKEVHLVAFMRHEQDTLLRCLETTQHLVEKSEESQDLEEEQKVQLEEAMCQEEEVQNDNLVETSVLVRARKRRKRFLLDELQHQRLSIQPRQRRRRRRRQQAAHRRPGVIDVRVWIGWGWSGAPLAHRVLGPCWGDCS